MDVVLVGFLVAVAPPAFFVAVRGSPRVVMAPFVEATDPWWAPSLRHPLLTAAVARLVGLASRLLIELLEPVLKLGQVVDLVLEQLHLVVLLNGATIAAVLELAHLVHPRNDLLLGDVVLGCLRHLFRLIDDLDGGDVGAVALVVGKVHVVRQQEVHEALLLVRGQLREDERLGGWLLGRRHLLMVHLAFEGRPAA
eukprot:CAMPEP_0170464532 /NCGR_PEP_ID=MMETSP0123-20130129/9221_1 /TAXON_ID=182087 /ORGANISM="Favella ehrenbergii, Strain Fehren 1" /LENGTH=195 /DNA_ID=CAMNT_0010730213 /DNA_START=1385 /DNA_END=1974 /DNA_ORIENTATION=+